VIASLVVLGLILLFLAFSVSRSARRSREAAEARRRQEEAMRQGGGESPFAGSPFGSIFDQLFSGTGMRSRSLTYDPETGQWVDISDEYPQGEEPAAAEGERSERSLRAPQQQQQQRQPSAGPLGGLSVEPPADARRCSA
jgi:flagellar biosynthesis/type III secretory pathway M-ring protein FliF/YscJ